MAAEASTAGKVTGRTSGLARIAWAAIALGVVMEALLLVLRAGRTAPSLAAAEGLGKVTWSLIVCLGLALGKVISDNKPYWAGLAGLVSAPLAFTLAQGVQRMVAELSAAGTGSPLLTPTVMVMAVLRGLEYMILGSALALIAQREGRLPAYLLAAAGVAAVFGGLILVRMPATATSVSGMVGWGVNELLFPLGCAAVLYAGENLIPKPDAKVSTAAPG